jgi:hypothetical protein
MRRERRRGLLLKGLCGCSGSQFSFILQQDVFIERFLRGLQFTYLGLKASLANKTEELTASFTGAYDKTLKQYHNFVVKGTFSVRLSLPLSPVCSAHLVV